VTQCRPRQQPLEPLHDRCMRDIVQAMKQIGVDARIIYATEKTGMIVTEQNVTRLTPDQLAEWHAALDEFEARA